MTIRVKKLCYIPGRCFEPGQDHEVNDEELEALKRAEVIEDSAPVESTETPKKKGKG